METDAVPEVRAPSTASRLSRIRRLAGTMMIVVGAALLVWCLVVWRWNDPFTAMYTRWEQRKLETRYAEIDSPEGHDAFLKEWDQLTDMLRPFVQQSLA